MIIPAQTLRKIKPVTPFYERMVFNGMSYGLSAAGYDIRVNEEFMLHPGEFVLASSVEHFDMPNDILAQVCDKSSLARQGLFVQNTIIEPGWKGFLTLELTYHANKRRWLGIEAGQPIAQIIFHRLEEATEKPYDGKYQNQESGPQAVRFEGK